MSQRNKYIYGASTWLWCMFIYSLSADTGTVSGGKSMMIAETIERIFRAVFGTIFTYDAYAFAFSVSHIMRKCGHMAEFAVLAVLLTLLARSISGRLLKLLPFICTVIYAASDEIHQAFVPGRGPGVGDVIIDAAGAAIGIMIVYKYLKSTPRGAFYNGKLKTES